MNNDNSGEEIQAAAVNYLDSTPSSYAAYEKIDAFKAGANWHASQSKQVEGKGMRWVKAEERLPDELQRKNYRTIASKIPIPYRQASFSVSFGNKYLRFWNSINDIETVNINTIEWLDESEAPEEVNRLREALSKALNYVNNSKATITEAYGEYSFANETREQYKKMIEEALNHK